MRRMIVACTFAVACTTGGTLNVDPKDGGPLDGGAGKGGSSSTSSGMGGTGGAGGEQPLPDPDAGGCQIPNPGVVMDCKIATCPTIECFPGCTCYCPPKCLDADEDGVYQCEYRQLTDAGCGP